MSFSIEPHANSPTGASPRTRFGVGERVDLTSDRPVVWSVDRNQIPTTRKTHVFNEVGSITLRASENGRQVWSSPQLTIVAPSIETQFLRDLAPMPDHIGCAFQLMIQLNPLDVSFAHLFVREGRCVPTSVWGYFRDNRAWFGAGLNHDPDRGSENTVGIGAAVAGLGAGIFTGADRWSPIDSLNAVMDTASFLYPESGSGRFSLLPTPYVSGGFTWLIPWEYRIGTQVFSFGVPIRMRVKIALEQGHNGSRPFRGVFTVSKGTVLRHGIYT